MSDYSKTTNFTAKDALTTGDPEKTILGSDMDTEFDNISTSVATKLDKSGGNVTGSINEAKGSDIASAATTDIGAATGNYVDVTGTTTITGLGTVQAGTRRIVQFDGSLTLTYNATSLILPGNVDIVTQAGDVAEFVSLGSGNWICVNYENHHAVSGYVSGVTTFIEGDVGADSTGFNLITSGTAVIGTSFESVGPTGSSATNTWTALDSLPSKCKFVIVKMEYTQVGSSVDYYAMLVGYRKTGSSTTPGSRGEVLSSWNNTAGSSLTWEITHTNIIIPLDDSNRFDLKYNETGTSPSNTISMFLVGWGI